MMSRSQIFISVAGLLITGCALRPEAGKLYTPSQVVHSIDKLHGRTVRVAGYLELGPEARGLWDSEGEPETLRARSPEDPLWSHCISVYYDRAGAAAIGRVSRAMVEVIGKIGTAQDDPDRTDLWACSSVHITITGVVRKRVIKAAD